MPTRRAAISTCRCSGHWWRRNQHVSGELDSAVSSAVSRYRTIQIQDRPHTTTALPDQASPVIVFDTDVASRSFKDRLPPTLAARLAGAQPLLTFVTVGELTQWTRLRQWGPRNRAMLEAWLSDKPVIPGSKSIASAWGELSAAATQRGRPRPVNDTWVAACCVAYGPAAGNAERQGLR